MRQTIVELPGGASCWDGINLKTLELLYTPGGYKVGYYGDREELSNHHGMISNLHDGYFESGG